MALGLCCMQAFSSGVPGLFIVATPLVAAHRLLGTRASVFVVHSLSCCGSWALLLHSMWYIPRPGIEPLSPALAGGFLTTGPPGTSSCMLLF